MMEASSPAIAYGPSAGSAGFPLALGLFGDERLAKLVANGNERAFTVLFERYHQPLYRYCRSILRHESDAQDALQTAFAGALVALRRGQRDAPLRPWLFRIAHNESVSLLRRRRISGQELLDGAEPLVASAEERVQEREQLALLVSDLQELPDRQRGALVMRELSGLSHEEIAAALGTSPGTAKQAIFEARSALLEFAEGRAMGCEEICRTISDGDRRALRARRVRAHLRGCGSCAAFATAIPSRRADLHAFAAPLAPLAAAGVLGRLTGGGSAAGGTGGGSVGSGAASTMAGKLAGVGLTSKALATVAVVTGTAAGVAGTVNHLRQIDRHSPATTVSARSSAGATGSAAASGRLRIPALASGVASKDALQHRGSRSASASSQSRQDPGHTTVGSAHSRAATAQAKPHGRSNAAAQSAAASSTSRAARGKSSAHRTATAANSSQASKSQKSQHSAGSSAQPPANSASSTARGGAASNGSANAASTSSPPASSPTLTVREPAQAAQQAGLKLGNSP